MSTAPVTEHTITAALRRLPPERWPEVLAFINSLQAAFAGGQGKHWTAAELRKLPAAERDAILAEQAAALVDLYCNDPELAAFEAFGP